MIKEYKWYYVDDIGNEWSKNHFTIDEAKAESKAMIYYPSRQSPNMRLLNKKKSKKQT